MRLLDKLRGPPTQDRFARLLMAGIRQAGETRKLVFDREQFLLRLEDKRFMNLVNLFDEYCSAEADRRDAVLRRSIRAWFEAEKDAPDSYEDARHDLLPSLRSRAYYEITKLQTALNGAEKLDWPHLVIAEHLMLSLAYDMPQSMQMVSQGDLDRWGVSFYEALEAARENLRQLESLAIGRPAPGVYVTMSGDNYDASRLILAELIEQLEVEGDPVAIVANRDTLILTGTESVEGLGAMADLAEEALQSPRLITGIALRLRDGEWEPWLPESTHPHYGKFRLLEIKSMYADYADQKELLDAVHEKQGVDLFVATYSAVQKEGEPETYCVWAQGVEALLPRTDRIAFMQDQDERVAIGDWARVQRVVGDLMEPLDLYPPRWRVARFPSQEQLRAIGTKGL